MRYLDIEDLLLMTRKLGAGPVQDLGLLESAAARPQTSLFGQDAYPTLVGKAAALLHSVCSNHALVDGNKRLAWFGAVTFLALNGHDVDLPDDDAFRLVMHADAGELDVAGIVNRLEPALRPRTA